MPALSKHGGGEEDRERPECVHSSAIQTELKPTGAGAFSTTALLLSRRPSPLCSPPTPQKPPRIYSSVKSASLFCSLCLSHSPLPTCSSSAGQTPRGRPMSWVVGHQAGPLTNFSLPEGGLQYGDAPAWLSL